MSQTSRRSMDQARRTLWRLTVLALVITPVVFGVYRRSSHNQNQPAASPMGWIELSQCAYTRSLDGAKWLTLAENQRAELIEIPKTDQNVASRKQVSLGRWTYDDRSKKYSLVINNKSNDYSILSLDGVATCILIQGALSAANLQESWFATVDNDPRESDWEPDYSERHEPH
jgi:hypothetical protein